jgi:hypothetical protein
MNTSLAFVLEAAWGQLWFQPLYVGRRSILEAAQLAIYIETLLVWGESLVLWGHVHRRYLVRQPTS